MNSTIDNKINEDYKMTKLGWIPKDWEVVKLGEIFSFKNGINASKEDYGKGIKFINVSEIFNNQTITASIIPGSVKIKEEAKQIYSVKRGDILFNRTSETLEEIAMSAVYLDDENVVFGGFVIRARPTKDLLLDDFKKYCFSIPQIRKQMISRGQGAIRTNIGQNDLSKIIITIPPLPEQQKIADILSTWDTAIHHTQQLIKAKQIQKQGLMQRLLTEKVRVKGFNEEWKKEKLGKICNITTGKLDANAMVKNGKYRFYTCAREYFHIDEYAFDKEVLLISGNGANVGYIHYYNGKFNAYQRTYVLSEFSQNIIFLKYYLNKYLKKRIISEVNEGNTPYIRLSTLSGMPLRLPSLQEQKAIATILSTADEEIRLLETQLSALQAQKKGLMQQLLTGKIRVNV